MQLHLSNASLLFCLLGLKIQEEFLSSFSFHFIYYYLIFGEKGYISLSVVGQQISVDWTFQFCAEDFQQLEKPYD